MLDIKQSVGMHILKIQGIKVHFRDNTAAKCINALIIIIIIIIIIMMMMMMMMMMIIIFTKPNCPCI